MSEEPRRPLQPGEHENRPLRRPLAAQEGYQQPIGWTEAQIAQHLQIPAEKLNVPDVQEYVARTTRIENLVHELSVSEDRHLYDTKLAAARDHLAAPDMTLPLNARYAAAKELVSVAASILEESVGAVSSDYRGFAATRINRAFRWIGGGYDVVKDDKSYVDPEPGSSV